MAPSLRPAALPAVTRPWARNGVRSAARSSTVVPGAAARRRVFSVQPWPGFMVATGTRSGWIWPVAVGGRELVLRGDGVGVGAVLGDGGEAVVQVLGGVAHVQGGGVHEPLGDEARVGVRAGAHRVVAHVLHAAGDDDVVGTEADAAGRGGHRGHGAGAHAVDGESGDGAGEAGQQGGGAADGQALVAGLGGGGNGDLVDRARREGRIAAQQFADAFDHQVVGAGAGVDALVTGLAEGGADAVDEDDVADRARVSAASVVAHV